MQKCTALMQKLGAQPDPTGHKEGCYLLETRYGQLRVTIYADGVGPWVATCFEDVARAKGNVFGPQLNPFSGKWNFHTEDVGYIEQHMMNVMPKDALNRVVPIAPAPALVSA